MINCMSASRVKNLYSGNLIGTEQTGRFWPMFDFLKKHRQLKQKRN